MTNSCWSNNGHKEDIAKGLLKGVLHLQESLVILRKLQENSSYKSKRKQKLKQKLEEVISSGDMGNGLMDLNRFGFLRDQKKQFTGPTLSQMPQWSSPTLRSAKGYPETFHRTTI